MISTLMNIVAWFKPCLYFIVRNYQSNLTLRASHSVPEGLVEQCPTCSQLAQDFLPSKMVSDGLCMYVNVTFFQTLVFHFHSENC